jgi:hypothetical protein
MKFAIRAEYACGHPSRAIVHGTCRPHRLREDLERLVAKAAADGDLVSFQCDCGRGAAYVEVVVDGRVVERVPASRFRDVPGARLTRVIKDD